jgi:hypothetical protein
MSSAPIIRAWQLSPLTRFGLVSAAALFALSLDSLFVWSATSNRLISVVLVAAPLVVAVRVTRGFDRSLHAAFWTFAGAIGLAASQLRSPSPAPSWVTASASAALLLSAVGIAVSLGALLEGRARPKPPAIAIAPEQLRDPLARASSR